RFHNFKRKKAAAWCFVFSFSESVNSIYIHIIIIVIIIIIIIRCGFLTKLLDPSSIIVLKHYPLFQRGARWLCFG
ncbi:hypothetical protein DKP78_17980, partial [Enterococcus faecium]